MNIIIQCNDEYSWYLKIIKNYIKYLLFVLVINSQVLLVVLWFMACSIIKRNVKYEIDIQFFSHSNLWSLWTLSTGSLEVQEQRLGSPEGWWSNIMEVPGSHNGHMGRAYKSGAFLSGLLSESEINFYFWWVILF